MSKRQITNICAVAIIYRESDPTQLFLEIKDNTYPIKLVRGQLCLIGGNWIGKAATKDLDTRATLCRKIREELSLNRPIRTMEELVNFGQSCKIATMYTSTLFNSQPNEEDRDELADLVRIICADLTSFGDFINTTLRATLNAADPTNTCDGYTTLASYFTAQLNDSDWMRLKALQMKFGNISNEFNTIITSARKIRKRGANIAFCHDRVLQAFLLGEKVLEAIDFPLVSGLSAEYVGRPLESYNDYLKKYDVLKKP